MSHIYSCLSSYNSSNIERFRMSKPRQRERNIRAKVNHVTDCVFLPAHTISNEQGYTQFVHGLIGGEACRALWVASSAYASLPEISLWGESFHQLSSRCRPRFGQSGAVAVLMGIADGSDGGNEDGRAPIFSFPIRSSAALWDQKPTLRFFPPEKGLDVPPVFLRGDGRGGHRWAFAKLKVCTSILWMNIKQNKV